VYDALGRLAAEYDQNTSAPPCTTCYLSYDHLGSLRLVTDENAKVIARHDYIPFGEETPGGIAGRSGQFDAPDNVSQRFTGQERDTETSLDYFGARYYASGMGRFTSPDLLGGHLYDPQTLNKYVYVRNNPLSFTDPSGLDFYLTCTHTKDNGDTCQQVNNGGQKTWVQGTTTNGQFSATVISNGANGSLVDQNGNLYTGTFNQNGVSFTSDNGKGITSSAVFQNGSNDTTLTGSGLFQGFKGVFNDNCGGTCVASGSIFGTKDQFRALKEQMLQNPGIDAVDFFHGTFFAFGPQNYRFGNATGPDAHVVSRRATEGAGSDEFHYDGSYPYASVPGFLDHTGSALRSIGHIFTGPQSLPPPTTVP
jgi:RHS repeat-associated protein